MDHALDLNLCLRAWVVEYDCGVQSRIGPIYIDNVALCKEQSQGQEGQIMSKLGHIVMHQRGLGQATVVSQACLT